MVVAVVIHIASATELQSGFRIAFGIEFYQLQPVRGNVRHEGDEMFLGHGMVDRNEMLIFHLFDGQQVVFVRFFRFQRRQCDATAADDRVAKAVNGIARKCLTLTMFFIGASLSVGTLKLVGVKPLLQGVILWMLVSAVTLAFIVFC